MSKKTEFTLLPNGEKISKADKLLVCTGSVEELISLIGILKSKYVTPGGESRYEVAGSVKLFLNARLTQIQEALHDIITSLTVTRKLSHRYDQTRFNGDEKLKELDEEIEKMGVDLNRAKTVRFLPGVSEFEADISHARSLTRRTERQIISLKNGGIFPVEDSVLMYINRISDYFLSLAVFTLFRENRTPLQVVAKK